MRVNALSDDVPPQGTELGPEIAGPRSAIGQQDNALRVLWIEDKDVLVSAVLRSASLLAPSWAFSVVRDMSASAEWQASQQILRGCCDVLLLDRAFPERPNAGIELLGEIRAKGCQVAAIVLSGWESPEDRMKAFEAGADDFVAKGGLLVEDLCARILVAYRRSQQRASSSPRADPGDSFPTSIGPIQIDARTKSLVLDGRPLPPHQQRLLWCLIDARGQLIPRDDLCDAAGIQKDPQFRNLNTELWRLRALLGAESARFIESVRGRGVRLCLSSVS